MAMYDLYLNSGWAMSGFFLLVLWTLVWKGLGLWYSGVNKQKGWFIAMLILNTMGILPIIYLIWFKPKEKVVEEVKPKNKKKS